MPRTRWAPQQVAPKRSDTPVGIAPAGCVGTNRANQLFDNVDEDNSGELEEEVCAGGGCHSKSPPSAFSAATHPHCPQGGCVGTTKTVSLFDEVDQTCDGELDEDVCRADY